MEKIIDFIRIVLLVGLVLLVFDQNRTINQLETRIVSLNNHVIDLNDNIDDQNTFITQEHGATLVEEEMGELILQLMSTLINKIDEDNN